jgi:hypothetical protein
VFFDFIEQSRAFDSLGEDLGLYNSMTIVLLAAG